MRPELIQLQAADLLKQPKNKQTTDNENFRMFSRRIDLFYVFEESRVKLIQDHVKEVCVQLIKDQEKFTIVPEQEEHLFNKEDLVFGKLSHI